MREPRLHSVTISDHARRARRRAGANERGRRMKSIAFRDASAVSMMIRCFVTTAALVLCIAGCQTPYPAAPVSAATPDYDYHIGPLDVVNVIVWRNPELSLSVPVRAHGHTEGQLGIAPHDHVHDVERSDVVIVIRRRCADRRSGIRRLATRDAQRQRANREKTTNHR